jgi:hypothetical protein
MADARNAPSMSPLSSVEGLMPIWDHFRGGGTARCPIEGGPMALAVDGASESYRFVCVGCGNASPWFEAHLEHLAIRGPSVTEPGTSEE